MRVKLNQAQKEMFNSERVYGKYALPVISVKLGLADFSAEQVMEAAGQVLESADIFRAALYVEGDKAYFVPDEREIRPCVLGEEMTKEEAAAYMERRDRMPLAFPEELYGAEVLPLREGGAILYVRFHHVIMDGYGMSLFAQRALDALMGRKLQKSVFFSHVEEEAMEEREDCQPQENSRDAGPRGEEGCGRKAAEVNVEEDSGQSAEEDAEQDAEINEKSDVEENDRFWREYFKGADFEPSLFFGTGQDAEKISVDYSTEEALSGKLQRFAEENHVTVPYVLAAAYGIYLAQASGKKDGVFFMARLNRRQEELQTLGCYTLPVPVRVHVEQTDSFGDVCRRVQENARLASAHKSGGFERMMKALKEEGFTAGSLSEYAFNFYSYEVKEADGQEISGEGKASRDTKASKSLPEYTLDYSVSGGINNHFRWNLFKKDGKLTYVFDLRKGVYDKEKAEYFAEAIGNILEYGLSDARVCDIPSVGQREKEYLLGIRGKEIEIDGNATIPSLFRKAVEKYGRRPALYAGEYSCSFEQLDMLSDAAAARLLDRGVGSGDIVAFLLKRDIRLIPVLLGISKTGAAFVPIDPKYPRDRIQYILNDSGAKYLISSKEAGEAAGREYLDVDELFKGAECWKQILAAGRQGQDVIGSGRAQDSQADTGQAQGSQEDTPKAQDSQADSRRPKLPPVSQEQTAYLIYTSGTTGRPKGVMLSHKGIANIVHPDNNPFNRDVTRSGRGITAIGSICFDISLFEIFVPLFNGLFVELGNEKAMLDAGELAEHILRHGADILHCTPSRVVSYLENPRFAEALSCHVKSMLLAGEQLPESLVKELTNHYQIRVYNGYGPTETTIGAAITEAGDSRSIGRPIGNTGIVLLNGDRKPVPYGAAGEICVYGHGVGIGYKNRAEETEDKFILWEGKRLYRTGDLGHFDSEGRLIYQGRNDRQIKLRGLRIELSEIEKVMGACPGVLQAACIVRKTERGEHLAGFYTAAKEGRVEKEELRAFMKKRLTSYMVPEVLAQLQEMPQTPGGKTDLKALKEIEVEYARSYTAPASKTEKVICNAFSDVLGVERIGTQDNFFELGGDSLSAVELIAALEKELEWEAGKLDYESLFRYPTPALLAEKIGGNVEEQNPYSIAHMDYNGIDDYLRGNIPQAFDGKIGRREHLGNVLLTGATGYLGIHILIELLQDPNICRKVYCLVRPKGRLTAQKRMQNSLFYYAETDFSDVYGEKWEVVEGDITDSHVFAQAFMGQIDTIINSAANVAHYAYGDALENVNRNGVKNLIDYAAAQKALFCQISTISVGGMDDAGGEEKEFSERNFYIGQKIYNQYIYSKYMAEYELLRAAVDRGIGVKIMRVGNLQGRSRDGEFQMNLKSNGFTRKLFSYIKMGAVPDSVYHASVNFSPVDETAHMILTLAKTDARFPVFHVYPPEEAPFESLFRILEKKGYKIDVVSEEEFGKRFQKMKRTKEGRALVEGLLTENPEGTCQEIPVVQKVTEDLLDLAGEAWRPLTEEYLEKYLSALEGMNM